MTREILNLEAELEEVFPDGGWDYPNFWVVVSLGGHELYRFQTENAYNIQEKGLKLSEEICDHVKGLLRKDGDRRGG